MKEKTGEMVACRLHLQKLFPSSACFPVCIFYFYVLIDVEYVWIVTAKKVQTVKY